MVHLKRQLLNAFVLYRYWFLENRNCANFSCRKFLSLIEINRHEGRAMCIKESKGNNI